VQQLAYLGVTFLGATLLMKWAFSQIDPNKVPKEKVRCRCSGLAPLSAQRERGPPSSGAGRAGLGQEEGHPAPDWQAHHDGRL